MVSLFFSTLFCIFDVRHQTEPPNAVNLPAAQTQSEPICRVGFEAGNEEDDFG